MVLYQINIFTSFSARVVIRRRYSYRNSIRLSVRHAGDPRILNDSTH